MTRIFLLIFIIKVSALNAQWLQLGADAEFSGYSSPSFGYLSLTSDRNGNIYVAGNFTNTNSDCSIPKWNGTNWSKIQGLNDPLNSHSLKAIFCDSTSLYAVGSYTNASGSSYLAKWDGSIWSDLGNPTTPQYYSMYDVCGDANGTIYAAFHTIIGANLTGTNIARLNNGNWMTLPQIPGWTYYKSFTSFCADKFGNLYAVGGFTNSSGNYYVAKWDGTNWSELGGQNSLGASKIMTCVHLEKNGNLYVGGYNTNTNAELVISKWNGTTWSTIPCDFALPVQSDELITDISSDSGGNIYVSGAVRSKASGNIVVGKWNGATWAEINVTMQPQMVWSMCADAAGNLYATGDFKNALGNYFVAMFPNANRVGIENHTAETVQFELLPNPAHGSLTIKLHTSLVNNTLSTIRIENGLGSIVYEQATSQQEDVLDLSNLTSGLYYVSLWVNGISTSKKLAIE
jgi:hypothetical protein